MWSDPGEFSAYESPLAEYRSPAVEMYTGQQHARLMRGVEACEGTDIECEVSILSAGYGLISGHREIVPYEVTFQGMRKGQIQAWAEHLRIPDDVRQWFAGQADLNLVLLGESYLAAMDLDSDVVFATPTVFFCGKGGLNLIRGNGSYRAITLSRQDASRFSCGLVGLKGEIASLVLQRCVGHPGFVGKLLSEDTDILSQLPISTESQTQFRVERLSPYSGGAGAGSPQQKGSKRHLAKRQNAGTLYFIPEWDDRVDPEYDFSTDTPSGDRDPYEHDMYAHEIYSSPPYDGILVSKSVMEGSKSKKELMEKVGVHAYLRVSRDFPVMGDCGAFNYINHDVPPYETDETVHFYENLGFDFGVSIDHLIVPAVLRAKRFFLRSPEGGCKEITERRFKELAAQGVRVRKGKSQQQDLLLGDPVLEIHEEELEGEAQRRWNITLTNSQDFIEAHRRLGCSFVPVAGCQGWDIDSQVTMFSEQQDMGYEYIALGGLVRSPTSYIRELLDRINDVRKPDTKLHIFGVARLEAIKHFAAAGVDSVDSASMLRQAWLSATSNYYWTPIDEAVSALERGKELPKAYAALRVPPLHREASSTLTSRAKTVVDGGVELAEIQQCESQALGSLRAFADGEAQLDESLEAVMEYARLLGMRSGYEKHYRRILSDMPWERCPCQICRHVGIEVAIFRRNNRNRRRGFHNTWWFYQVFSRLVAPSAQDMLGEGNRNDNNVDDACSTSDLEQRQHSSG